MVRSHVYVCAAEKCYNTRISHPNKGFFGFPSDVTLCKTWLENCKRTDLEVKTVCKSNGYYKLCSDHFEDKWFTDSTKMLLNRNLCPVPSIFVNNVGSLLPSGSQAHSTPNIDLPMKEPLLDCDDPDRVAECDSNPTEFLMKNECLPLSYFDLPMKEPLLDCDDPDRVAECDSNPTEFLMKNECLPLSYCTPKLSVKRDYDPSTLTKALVNLRPESELYKLDELCRLCINKATGSFVELFSDTEEAREIRETCEIVMPKKIKICDGMPHKVCQLCINDLQTCRKLIEQFLNADRYLRAIAKYSIYIENKDDCEAMDSDDCNGSGEEEFVKPIQKNALIMPLKNFQPVIELPENFIKEESLSCDSFSIISEEELYTTEQDFDPLADSGADSRPADETFLDSETQVAPDFSDTVPSSSLLESSVAPDQSETTSYPVTQILQSLQFPISQISLITNEQNIWQKNVAYGGNVLLCSNVVLLPKEGDSSLNSLNHTEIVCKGPENPSDQSIVKVEPVEEVNHNQFGTSGSVVQDKLSNEKNSGQLEVEINFALLKNNLRKKLPQTNTDETETIVRSESSESTLFLKCCKCSEVYPSYQFLLEHMVNQHQENPNSSVCAVCSLDLETLTLLLTHLRLEHRIVVIKCPHCDEKNFKDEKELSDHIKLNHNHKCSKCDGDFFFNNKKQLSDHIQEKHIHKCLSCEAIFYTKDKLNRHINVKHLRGRTPNQDLSRVGLAPTECSFCGKRLKSISGRRSHESEHRDGPQVCWRCGQILKNKRSLHTHMQLHDSKTYTCEICNKVFNTLQAVGKHRRLHDPKNKIKKFSCEICSKCFLYKQGLESHMATHSDFIPYKCPCCNIRFSTRSSLKAHIRSEANSCKPPTNWHLDKCKFDLRLSSLRLRGPFQLDEPPGLQCDICGRKFYKNRSLTRHRKFHLCDGNSDVIRKFLDEPEVHKCNICTRHFFSKYSLQYHSRVHNGSVKPFVCDICQKTYSSHQQILLHERLHTGERPYKCSFCDDSFHEKVRMQDHEETHMKHKSHICQVCDETFVSRKRLLAHSTIHKSDMDTSLRPFICKYCDKRLPHKKSLLQHLRRVHHIDYSPISKQVPKNNCDYYTFACPGCKKLFLSYDTLKKHVRKKHEDIDLDKEFLSEEPKNEQSTTTSTTLVEGVNEEKKIVDEDPPNTGNIFEGATNNVQEFEEGNCGEDYLNSDDMGGYDLQGLPLF